jgi:hypothetical protein
VLGVPAQVVAQLIANYLQEGLDAWPARGNTRVPRVRYRDVVIEGVSARKVVREVYATAQFCRRAPRARRSWAWPERE